MRVERFTCLLLLLLFEAPLLAQETDVLPMPPAPLPRYGFETLTVQDGLPETFVRDLLQDRHGYLWVATQHGLVRYDGREMKRYSPRAKSSDVPFRNVSSLVEAEDGSIWAGDGIGGGLVRLNPHTEHAVFYYHDPADPATLSSNQVVEVQDAGHGRLLVLTRDRAGAYCLDRVNTSNGRVRRYRIGADGRIGLSGSCFPPGVPYDGRLRDRLYRDLRGRIWIPTMVGLLAYEATTDTLVHHRSPYLVRYDTPAYRALDSLQAVGRRLAAVERPRGEENLTVPFTVVQEAPVLFTGVGEMTTGARFDYGWVERSDGVVVWEMTTARSAWAGGVARNRIVVAADTLPAGSYRLRFRSDRGHQFNERWGPVAPDRPDWWGVHVLALPPGANHVPATVPVQKRPGDLPFDGAVGAYEDRHGRLWVMLSGGGLALFDRAQGKFSTFATGGGDTTGFRSAVILSMREDARGRLWAGTAGSGLYRIDDTVAVRHYTLPLAGRPSSEHERLIRNDIGQHSFVLQIEDDSDGTLWLRTYSSLIHFDPETGRTRVYQHDGQDPTSLGAGFKSVMLRDRQGTLWVGSRYGGLSRLDRTTGRFRALRSRDGDSVGMEVLSVVQAPDGMLWAGTSEGLSRVDTATGGELVPHPAWLHAHSESRPVGAGVLLIDRAGHFWVGGEGLNRFDPKQGILARYRNDPRDTTTISHNLVTALLQDGEGRLWVGTMAGGLNQFDPETASFTRFPYRTVPWGGVSDSLSDARVIVLYEDREEALWVGTNQGGLNRFDPASGRFTAYYDPARGLDCITAIYEDSKGRMWIGSYSGGLILFDRETGGVKIYNESSGLSHNHVASILEDDAGYLWLGTERGLSRFDPVNHTFRNFTAADGVPILNLRNDGIRTRDGSMLVYGRGGIVSFDPSNLAPNAEAPNLVLETLVHRQSGGREIRVPLSARPGIRLAHDENDFTIGFTGIHFERPDAVRYAYTLDGYDEDWIDAGTQQNVRYTSLHPGSYTFRVKAANVDGVWSTPQSVQLTIRPPWWQTPWAYGFYGLLLIAGFFGADRVQRRRLLRKEREAARERELVQKREIERAYTELKGAKDRLVQQEKMASLGQLTAGIAHEIKNPLNFINNFASLTRELLGEIRAERRKEPDRPISTFDADLDDLALNASKIEEHGRRADGIVRSMLEHSRGGLGERKTVQLNGFVEEYVNLAYHGMRAQVPDFTTDIIRDYDASTGHVDLVPQEMGRVLLNLLNNAFYAVHAKRRDETGSATSTPAISSAASRERVSDHESPRPPHIPTVIVSTRRVDGRVEIRISDNGPGIAEENRQKIFEPFFTTKPTGEGTGLGLSLSFEIVTQGHGGVLSVESDEGQGATFAIQLPV